MKLLFLILVCATTFNGITQLDPRSNEAYDLRTLPEFCDSFPTDKCAGKHGFVEIYEPLFAPLRQDSIRFFEIGILNGVSHLMWRTYFRYGEIFGIDIRDYTEKSKGTGIMTFVADQSKREDLGAFIDTSGGQFDVILDDGGHAMDQQQISFGVLFPEVKPGGMYIIEDVHTSLPVFYPDTSFHVNEAQSNTTLLMLEHFVRTGELSSEYLTIAESEYLQRNIDRIELHYRRNKNHSIVCVIHKVQ